MVAATLRYGRIPATGVTPETIEHFFSKLSDTEFGVKKEHLELGKRLQAYNLRHGGRKDRITSKYFNVEGKCVDISAPIVRPEKTERPKLIIKDDTANNA